MVQGIVHAGDHAGLVAKRGVQGDIFNPFPIDPNLTWVTQAFQILSPGHRTRSIFPLRVPTHLIVFAHLTYAPNTKVSDISRKLFAKLSVKRSWHEHRYQFW